MVPYSSCANLVLAIEGCSKSQATCGRPLFFQREERVSAIAIIRDLSMP